MIFGHPPPVRHRNQVVMVQGTPWCRAASWVPSMETLRRPIWQPQLALEIHSADRESPPLLQPGGDTKKPRVAASGQHSHTGCLVREGRRDATRSCGRVFKSGWGGLQGSDDVPRADSSILVSYGPATPDRLVKLESYSLAGLGSTVVVDGPIVGGVTDVESS